MGLSPPCVEVGGVPPDVGVAGGQLVHAQRPGVAGADRRVVVQPDFRSGDRACPGPKCRHMFLEPRLASAPVHHRAHLAQPKGTGLRRLDDYRPIALGQLDMKLLTGPLTQRITEVLTRHGVVSNWQQGALPGSNTGPPPFMAQRQLQR